MKIIILLLLLGMIMPVFAQESTLGDVANQLENQISQDNLKELEQRVSELENQPSFGDQVITNDENSKILDRLSSLENKIKNNNNFDEIQTWIAIIGSVITGVALFFVGYETKMSRDERKNTLRAWINQTNDITVKKFIDEKGVSYQKDVYIGKSEEEKKNINIAMIEWMMFLKNSGRLPALVKGRIKVVIGREAKRSDVAGEYSPSFLITPEQEHQFVFKITPSDHNSLVNDNTLSSMVFDFSYTSEGSSKERRYGFIGIFSSGTYIIVDTWNEKTFSEIPTFNLEKYIDKIKNETNSL